MPNIISLLIQKLCLRLKLFFFHRQSYRKTDQTLDAPKFHYNGIIMVWRYNKRPKGPHIVHLSTMCHLFEESAKAEIFVHWSASKTQTKDVEILLPVKFPWIPFSGFRGEVANVSANQRPGLPSCFSNRPENHKLGRGQWDLASCQVSLNSYQRFQRRSRKCLSQSEARAAILLFWSAWKTQTW